MAAPPARARREDSLTAPVSDITTTDTEGAQQNTAEAPSGVSGGLGPLLDEKDPKKVCAAIQQLLRDDAPNRKRRRAEWECYKLWLRGVRGARVQRQSEDYNAVELKVPLGAFDLPPLMDRCDELLEKVVAHLHADPALPDAEPATDSDADRDAAEFTTRLLTVEGSESGYNHEFVTRRAQRKAGVYGSGFVYPCIDPTGGGWRPMEIRALQTAMTVQDATTDPMTGAPLSADDPRLVTRYVSETGQLVDDTAQAKRQWLPKIVPEVLTGEQIVLLPQSCTGINDANGIVVIRFTPLGKLRAMFPETLGNASVDLLQKIVEWDPEDTKHAQPGFLQGKQITNGKIENGEPKDSALVCTLSLYYTSHGSYPKGAYIVVAGGETVLHTQPWAGMVEVGPGKNQEECLMLPCAQFRQFNDDIHDDPYGYGLVRKLGPADEVRGDIVQGWMEYLERFLHPIPFLPIGSIVQPHQITDRDDTPVFFNPQGKPEFEDTPEFPPDAKEMFDRATAAQDSATMLDEGATSASAPNVKSGDHAEIVVQQAHVNLSSMRGNDADGQERLWRIVTQLYRVFFTVPMKMKFLGEDGSYKLREWSRADLGSTKDIKIARGSFTQQSPQQKQMELDQRFAMVNPATGQPMLDVDEYERLSASNIRAKIGVQDNPHRLRIRRQISAWREGDANAFADVRPVDYEQDVALIRHAELKRTQAGSHYEQSQLRQQFDQEYTLMRQAAGIATLAEQQQAAAQQQQQATDAEQQKTDSSNQSKERQQETQLAAQGAEAEADRAFQQDMAAQSQEMDLQREAMRQQGAPVPA